MTGPDETRGPSKSCLTRNEGKTKLPDDFGDISLTKEMIGKYLKENCSFKLNL